MKLLVAGDLHLGRASSRVTAAPEGGLHTCTAAWARLVDCALAEQVDLVLLTGDLVDERNRFWEALGPLQRGLERLAEAGVQSFAVAGNHDHDVLPRLADALGPGRLRLLGRGGRWECISIEREHEEVVRLAGWSFPRREVTTSPLDAWDVAAAPSVVTLGMVHGALDDPQSRYAPLDQSRLRSLPVSAWLLGHQHAPKWLDDGGPWILYPGSPQAMDPGEPGLHGAWLVTLEQGRPCAPDLVPLSSVRYETVAVDLTGVDSEDLLGATVLSALRAEAGRLVRGSGSQLRALGLRLRLEGRTRLRRGLARMVERVRSDLELPVEGAEVTVESVRIEAGAEIDLEEHARGNAPTAVLARLLLDLDREQAGEQTAALVRATQARMNEIRRRSDFATLLHQEPIGARDARRVLRQQGQALLAELLGQNG